MAKEYEVVAISFLGNRLLVFDISIRSFALLKMMFYEF
jgi:hypothetical protein